MRRPAVIVLWVAACVAGSAVAGWAAKTDVAYDPHGRRDPFEALMTPAGDLRSPRIGAAGGLLRVEGVLWDPVQPLAIINGEVRRVGDLVDEYRVVDIQPQAVVVESKVSGRSVIPVVSGGGTAGDAP